MQKDNRLHRDCAGSRSRKLRQVILRQSSGTYAPVVDVWEPELVDDERESVFVPWYGVNLGVRGRDEQKSRRKRRRGTLWGEDITVVVVGWMLRVSSDSGTRLPNLGDNGQQGRPRWADSK